MDEISAENPIGNGGNGGGEIGRVEEGSGIAETEIGGIPLVSPGSGAGAADSGIKRGRGRPRGTGQSGTGSGSTGSKRSQEKAIQSSLSGIETLLYSLHAMASAVVPELKIDQDEARQLPDAVAKVNEYYETTIDPKMMAWVGLFAVCGKIYGPRIIVWNIRRVASRPKLQPFKAAPQRAPETAPKQMATPANVIADPAFISFPR